MAAINVMVRARHFDGKHRASRHATTKLGVFITHDADPDDPDGVGTSQVNLVARNLREAAQTSGRTRLAYGFKWAYFSGAFATTNVAFDPNAPMIGIGGEISDAEMSVFLRNCSCPNDRFFLSELLGGEKIEIELSEDMYMNGMEAEVSVLNDVPTISLKAGYIK